MKHKLTLNLKQLSEYAEQNRSSLVLADIDLSLSDSLLTDEEMPELVRILQQISYLTKLDLSINRFGDVGLRILSEHLLARNPYPGLKSLDLSINRFTPASWPVIINMIMQLKLPSIKLSNIKIDESSMKLLADMLISNVTLKKMSLFFSGLDAKTNLLFAAALNENTMLESLEITSPTIADITSNIIAHPTLKQLIVHRDTSTVQPPLNVKKISELLTQNNVLEKIVIFNAQMGLENWSKDALDLAAALRSNKTLQSLTLCIRDINEHQAEAFCEAIKHNYTLLDFEIDLPKVYKTQMQAYLQRNQSLHPALRKNMRIIYPLIDELTHGDLLLPSNIIKAKEQIERARQYMGDNPLLIQARYLLAQGKKEQAALYQKIATAMSESGQMANAAYSSFQKDSLPLWGNTGKSESRKSHSMANASLFYGQKF